MDEIQPTSLGSVDLSNTQLVSMGLYIHVHGNQDNWSSSHSLYTWELYTPGAAEYELILFQLSVSDQSHGGAISGQC